MAEKDIIEDVKKHPVIKTVGAIFTFVTLIITGFITIDERYAHAVDIKELKAHQSASILYIKDENERALLEMRKRVINDKLFELELKENKTNTDKALIKRYEAEAKEINQMIIQIEHINKSRVIQIK